VRDVNEALGVAAALVIILQRKKRRKRPIFWQSSYLESRFFGGDVISEVRELDKADCLKILQG